MSMAHRVRLGALAVAAALALAPGLVRADGPGADPVGRAKAAARVAAEEAARATMAADAASLAATAEAALKAAEVAATAAKAAAAAAERAAAVLEDLEARGLTAPPP